MDEQRRIATNLARLELLDSSIRELVGNALRIVEACGYRPVIDKNVWRTPAEQLALYRAGRTRLRWGYHCATRDGKPASLAADIICADRGWNVPMSFWLAVGHAARVVGLEWGGLWGLPPGVRRQLWERVREWPCSTEGIKLGWDPAHVQTAHLTVAQARALTREA